MMLHPSTILLLLLSALGVFATLGSNVEIQTVPDEKVTAELHGGYWFQEVDASKAKTISNKELQDGAETGYNTAKTKGPSIKIPQHPTGVKGPAIVVALFVPNHGTIIASTISTGVSGGGQSVQTCKTFDTVKDPHRSFYNCAEPNTISIAIQQGWLSGANGGKFPKGSKMAVYGKPNKKLPLGFYEPCPELNAAGKLVSGCQDMLKKYPEIEIANPPKKRAVDLIV
ncbi:hypothetical protein VPNG_06373 [Cytospora leucostoma]|uniref:Uncharacterized protein n=1 Tax=Cytospora leucostoma TaxID=1230097 RepID=A0A423WYS6_9PEZI|nr:hypothetical protein VPNG_06373 [Cytospora leucostoma]